MRDAAAARALFDEGVTCADRRDWACAADRFARARALRASPVIAYNLGHALFELGRLVEAAEVLRGVTRDEAASAQVRADARAMVERLTPRIGRLTLHVRGPIEGVTVRIGEVELPESLHGAPAPIDPGDHTIEAHRDGAVVASAAVHVEPGAQVEAELDIPPAPKPVAAADTDGPREVASPALGPAEPPRGGDDALWIGLGIGAGVLVIGGAIVLGVVLGQPRQEAPFDGNLGHVEVGR